MRLLLFLFEIGYGLVCENCLRPVELRAEPSSPQTQELTRKVLALSGLNLSSLEIDLIMRDLRTLPLEEVFRWVETGKLAAYPEVWRRNARDRMKKDFGEGMEGLFGLKTYWMLYTNPWELLPSLEERTETEQTERLNQDQDFCPEPANFPYTFPRLSNKVVR